jgi:hypothetical protein
MAGFGVAGVVIGFAMQSTLSNFAAGGMILWNRPFDLGDDIEVAGVSGTVRHMNLVSTTMLTGDNQTIVIPNSSIWGGVIRNQTTRPTGWSTSPSRSAYGDDVEKAERALDQIVSEQEQVLKEPAPIIRLHQLADSSVNFVVRVWTPKRYYWDVYWGITRAVKLGFDREDITIPAPQRDVRLQLGKAAIDPVVAVSGAKGLLRSARPGQVFSTAFGEGRVRRLITMPRKRPAEQHQPHSGSVHPIGDVGGLAVEIAQSYGRNRFEVEAKEPFAERHPDGFAEDEQEDRHEASSRHGSPSRWNWAGNKEGTERAPSLPFESNLEREDQAADTSNWS